MAFRYTQPCVKSIQQAVYTEINLSERESDKSFPSRAEIKNIGSFAPFPTYLCWLRPFVEVQIFFERRDSRCQEICPSLSPDRMPVSYPKGTSGYFIMGKGAGT